MFGYILRRLVSTIPVMFIVALIVFSDVAPDAIGPGGHHRRR